MEELLDLAQSFACLPPVILENMEWLRKSVLSTGPSYEAMHPLIVKVILKPKNERLIGTLRQGVLSMSQPFESERVIDLPTFAIGPRKQNS